MVESQPSKLLVASSILVSRSNLSATLVIPAGVAQLVEHLICNQRVGGSTPSASSSSSSALIGGVARQARFAVIIGQVAERSKATGCKPVAHSGYQGSNPCLSTSNSIFCAILG